MKSKIKVLAASLLLTGVFASQAASADILNAWQFNGSLLNGQALTGGGTVTGAGSILNIDHANFVGTSTINQNVAAFNAIGQTFTDSGVLQYNTTSPEGAGATSNFNFGTDGAGKTLQGYLAFTNLTGVLNPGGSITFNPGSGSIAFYLDNDTDLNPLTGNVLKVFDLTLLAPSGGSNLNFYGGVSGNSTVDITAQITNAIVAGILKDSGGNDVTLAALQLINADSLLDRNFPNNPNNTGIDPSTGNGVSVIKVQNNGQYNLATVPEPATLALMGMGLLGMGASLRKRKSS